MTKHTPGPWYVGVASRDGKDHLVVADKPENKTGIPLPMICVVTPIDQLNEADRYNAFLIAAAPDLYEAVKAFVALKGDSPFEVEQAILKAFDLGTKALIKVWNKQETAK